MHLLNSPKQFLHLFRVNYSHLLLSKNKNYSNKTWIIFQKAKCTSWHVSKIISFCSADDISLTKSQNVKPCFY